MRTVEAIFCLFNILKNILFVLYKEMKSLKYATTCFDIVVANMVQKYINIVRRLGCMGNDSEAHETPSFVTRAIQ